MAKDVKQAHETEVFRAFIEAGRSDHQGGGVWFHVEPVAVALLKAHKAGVNVRVVVDKRNATARYTAATVLANQGVQVRADYRYAIVHDKFIVVDGDTVETGSFNFTAAASSKNAENVLVLHDLAAAQRYEREWEALGRVGGDGGEVSEKRQGDSRTRTLLPWGWCHQTATVAE